MAEIRIGIIGGGAAGMMAAITAARQGAEVTVLEGNSRLGKKLLSTGNGKCNLGNRKLDISEYYCGEPKRLGAFLNEFDTDDVISFFQGLGVVLKEKNGGLYPACEQAAVVQDALRYELRGLGVHEVTDCKIRSVTRENKMGKIQVSGGGSYTFDRVILACGGRAAPGTGSDGSGFRLAEQLGHSLTPMVPALVQLKCSENYFKSVSGVRAEAQITVYSGNDRVAVERGELQITDYGLSGIPVFQLSRVVNYILLNAQEDVEVELDFLPDYSPEAYEQLCISRDLLLRDGRTVEEYFTGMLHKKLMMLFIRLSGLKPGGSIREADPEQIAKVYQLCRQWRLHVNGSNSYENAQVCAGGVPLAEVTDQLESRKVPGVYFAGEILDVDGRCGGYNLHWAWCSGYLAAMAASRER